MDRNIRIARQLVRIAKRLVAGQSSFPVDCFNVKPGAEQFTGVKKDDGTFSLEIDFLEFSIDYSKFLEYAQDWQGGLSANRFDAMFKENLPEIIRVVVLGGVLENAPSVSYDKYDLFETRACINGLSIDKLDESEYNIATEHLDNIFMLA